MADTRLPPGKVLADMAELKGAPWWRQMDILLRAIKEPNGSACRQILRDNRALFQTIQGSTHNHQAWPGGYFDHVSEVLNIAYHLYPTMNEMRPLPFTVSDALLVLYLHDIEKPWKYEVGPDGHFQHKPRFATKADAQAFRMEKLVEHGIELTEEQLIALKYVEGEIDDYTPRERKMNELGAFCHICDVASARIWHAYPLAKADPWPQARRIRDAAS